METKTDNEKTNAWIRDEIDRRLEIMQGAILPMTAVNKPTPTLVLTMIAGQEALLQAVHLNTAALIDSELVPSDPESALMLKRVTMDYVKALSTALRVQLMRDAGGPTGDSNLPTPTAGGNGTVH